MTSATRGLRQLLSKRFNLEDLKTLCADLEVEFEDLPGEGRSAKSRELVVYLERRNQLDDLVSYLEETRPDLRGALQTIRQDLTRPPVRRALTRPRSYQVLFGVLAVALAGLAVAVLPRVLRSRPTSGPSALVYGSGLITYVEESGESQRLFALSPEGTPVPLVEGSGVELLAVAPGRDYLAVDLTQDDTRRLIVVSANGQMSNTVASGFGSIEAAFTDEGQLLFALREGNTISYTLAFADGSGQQVLYRSENVEAEPPVPEPTLEPVTEPPGP